MRPSKTIWNDALSAKTTKSGNSKKKLRRPKKFLSESIATFAGMKKA